jgi:hypothetical protein
LKLANCKPAYSVTGENRLSRLDLFLPLLQVDVCFLGCHLVSRQCHNILAMYP